MTARHFPPPWTVEDKGACFVVRDHAGQSLAAIINLAWIGLLGYMVSKPI